MIQVQLGCQLHHVGLSGTGRVSPSLSWSVSICASVIRESLIIGINALILDSLAGQKYFRAGQGMMLDCHLILQVIVPNGIKACAASITGCLAVPSVR